MNGVGSRALAQEHIRDWWQVFVFTFGVVVASGGWALRWTRRVDQHIREDRARMDALALDCDRCRDARERERVVIVTAVHENRTEQWGAINDLRRDTSEIKAGVARIEGLLEAKLERARHDDSDDSARRNRR